MDSQEFDSLFWITISTSLLTFFALVVRAVLKSRCHKCSACCFSCERAEGADGMDVDIEAPEVRYGADLCIPQKEFVFLFNQHCVRNNLTRSTFTPDFYAGPFSTRDIVVEIGTRMWEGRHFTNQPFIMGLTVDREDME